MIGWKKKEKKELQRWQVYLMFAILVVAFVLYIVQKARGVELVESDDAELLCAVSGGIWDFEQEVCLGE